MAEREELRRIDSEVELRVGMLVEVRGCRHGSLRGQLCGQTHRCILVMSTSARRFNESTGVGCWFPAWDVAPSITCAMDGLAVLGLAAKDGRLYEVITGNDTVTERAEGAADADKLINGIERMVRERAR